MHTISKEWNNFLDVCNYNDVYRPYSFDDRLEFLINELSTYHAVIDGKGGMWFETEEDFVLFKLRFS